MDILFLTQLIASFFVGGTVVALQTLFAEKASRKIAGLILGIPSTAGVTFFFLGWTLSAQTTAHIVPTTLVPAAVALCFVTTYVYIANSAWSRRLGKKLSMISTLLLSYLVWFVLALPSPFFKLTNIWTALVLYGVVMIFPVYFLTIRPRSTEDSVRLEYTKLQQLLRALFAGTVIALAVAAGKLFGPFWGALFATFPAVFTSMLLIMHKYHDPVFLFKMTRTLPLGFTAILLYLICVFLFFPPLGFVWGTVAAYAMTLTYSLFLSFLPSSKAS